MIHQLGLIEADFQKLVERLDALISLHADDDSFDLDLNRLRVARGKAIEAVNLLLEHREAHP